MAPGLPNGQGKGDGAGPWAERWDKGEVGNGVWDLGLRGCKGLGNGGDSDITQKYS